MLVEPLEGVVLAGEDITVTVNIMVYEGFTQALTVSIPPSVTVSHNLIVHTYRHTQVHMNTHTCIYTNENPDHTHAPCTARCKHRIHP